MRDRLRIANEDLRRRAVNLQRVVAGSRVPGVLAAYCHQVSLFTAALEVDAGRNLKLLDAPGVDLLPEVFDRTAGLARNIGYADKRLVPPLSRVGGPDEFPLHVLRWLHAGTKATEGLAFATMPDEFMVLPSPAMPAVYYLPLTQRGSLLSLPLLIHEFGHVLYECHRQEMDDLVKDFQEEVLRHLTPQSVGDPLLAAAGTAFRQQAVTRWQTWAQELFCDAVGLAVGGPAFLRAFSRHFHTLSRDEYALGRDALLRRKHPLTWLRVRRLADVARSTSAFPFADVMEREWAETARLLGLEEEHHGVWDDSLGPALAQLMERMLEEASPPRFDPAKSDAPTFPADPVRLFNRAWEAFEKQPGSYEAWERSAIRRFLAGA